MNQNFQYGPLTGMRILDLTGVIMGPFATHILADLGADVIKVESPEGDSTRNYKPLRHEGMAGSFLNLHRNKRGLLLDLKHPLGREALNRLIAGADAFVHNMRPKAASRLGFDYDAVRAIKPDIVYCGAYGFGAAGPYGDKAAYDDLIQAGSGIAGLFEQVHGEPAYVPTVICDKLAGQAIAWAILAALLQRARGGGGQSIEVPMLETSIEFTLVEHLGAAAFEPPLGKMGFPRLLSRRRKPYRTNDGYACILPYSDANWRDFFDFVGRPEFKSDPRFARLASRVAHIEILYGLIEEEAPKRSNAQWVTFCDAKSIPCMPVRHLDDLADDPHVKAVGLFGSAEHPSEGSYRSVRSPVNFSGAPFQIRHHAPRLGEHSAEVLQEAGFSAAEIEAMIKSGVTSAGPVIPPAAASASAGEASPRAAAPKTPSANS
jgi:crotonobetainyl-CoA:carnitine CoA-transferase CaiB-like acyl-CoA transferase